MKLFIKENFLISVICLISVLIILLYIFSMDISESFPHAADCFNTLFQLSIGFVINFMFYVTQFYIPRLKQVKPINDSVYIRILQIGSSMKSIFYQLAKIYIDGYTRNTTLTSEHFLQIMHKLDFDDEVNVVKITKRNMDNQNFTIKEWLVLRLELIEHDIDKLYTYYAAYISPKLMKILEDILNSPMHRYIERTSLNSPIKMPFKEYNEDIYFEPYYKLLEQLMAVQEEYI